MCDRAIIREHSELQGTGAEQAIGGIDLCFLHSIWSSNWIISDPYVFFLFFFQETLQGNPLVFGHSTCIFNCKGMIKLFLISLQDTVINEKW